jgi:demethylmenaquinone methyltransferase/2-methoxy-6-polyprenyl-1,4-benzoquinol methylase
MQVSKDGAVIRRMFAEIAPRYDLLNHVLSFNVDRRWRRLAVEALGLRPQDVVLDVCTGTADLALELARKVRLEAGGAVFGADFCLPMVALGERKRVRRVEERLRLLAADALRLPFPDGSFDAVAVAFGVRNLADLDAGLRELMRVLKPAGRLAVLEFTTPPRRWLRRLFHFYFHRMLPRIGALLSGRTGGGTAYRYLPASVAEFASPESLSRSIEAAGCSTVRFRLLSGGIAALYIAVKAAPAPPASDPALCPSAAEA